MHFAFDCLPMYAPGHSHFFCFVSTSHIATPGPHEGSGWATHVPDDQRARVTCITKSTDAVRIY